MTLPSDDSAPKPICFVISPIGDAGSETRKAADQVLKHLIRRALGTEYQIKRGDEESNPGSITSQIVESILEADLIIADLSGFNPNVYYEVAVAHGYERPTVHIQRINEKPAFDLKDMRLVRYDLQDLDNIEQAQKTLAEYARYAVANPAKVRTPLSDAKPFVQIGTSQDPVAQSNLEIMEQLRSLRTDVRRALRPRTTPGRNPDLPSLRLIVERAQRRGALDGSDFDSVITPQTSSGFDSWAKDILGRVTGEEDTPTLLETLYDDELLAPAPDEEPDERDVL